MCERAVEIETEALEYIPDHFKTKKMCERAVKDKPDTLEFVPGHLKMQKMCEKAVEECSYILEDVPDHFKMQKMCDAVVMENSLLLGHVSDWFVIQQQVKLRHDWFIGWYDGYKKLNKRRALIHFLHPSGWRDWCMSEDEKRETKKSWG